MDKLKILRNGKKKGQVQAETKAQINIKKKTKRSPLKDNKKIKKSTNPKITKKIKGRDSKANSHKRHQLVSEEEEDWDDTISTSGNSESDWDEEEMDDVASSTNTSDVEDADTDADGDDDLENWDDEPIKKKSKSSNKIIKKNTPKNKCNISYDEPTVANKIDMIDLPRHKQIKIFDEKRWNIAKFVKTANIDVDKLTEILPSRDSYFFGEDEYVYPNVSTLRKFVGALKNGEVTLKSVSVPFSPMNKIICHNPKIIVGITGVRHLQKAGGLAVWPIFYISKEQYNDSNRTFNTKILRVNFPLYKLDVLAESLLELANGLGFEIAVKSNQKKTN